MNSSPKSKRLEFAEFLDRLAIQRSTDVEWQRFIVVHYVDDFLEEIRRSVVRLYKDDLEIHSRTEAATVLLESWATLIRSSTNCLQDDADASVGLTLTESEAVVLDDFLRRYSDSDVLEIQHPAEQRALWNLQCVFEKSGNPNWKSVEEARAELAPTVE